jgi:hypothetical protein
MHYACSLVPTAARKATPEAPYADIVELSLMDDDFDLVLPDLESILQEILDEMV